MNRCIHCRQHRSDCKRCDRDVRVGDLDGHESRHGLYELLVAHGGQSHE